MFKKILVGLGIIMLGLLLVGGILAAIAPTDVHVEREIVIDRPTEAVFAQLRPVKNHETWSPWFKLDPNLKKEYQGEDGTVGFVMSWSGNDEVGAGEQEITKIVDGERIDYELRFKRPMEGTNTAYLITEPTGPDRTKVRWGMDGKMPVPFNVMCMVMGMRAMLAADFDKGLADLKQHLEKQPETQPAVTPPPQE